MKKIFRLLLALMLCISGNFVLVDAKAESLSTIAKEILDSKCVGCFNLEGVEYLDLEEPIYTNIINGPLYECEQCGGECQIFYIVYDMPFAIKDNNIKFSSYIVKQDCKKYDVETQLSDYPALDMSIIKSSALWNVIDIEGIEYYVPDTIMVEEKNERKFFSLINDKLNLITLDTEKINLYKNEECASKCVTVKNAYKIVESTGLSDYNFDNNMLVCKNCSECDICSNLVASNGRTANGKGISNYCPEHTCAFIWDVKVADGCENLTCKLANVAGENYCSTHKCGYCSAPIVGVNLNPILNGNYSPIHYYGSNEYGYSNYCKIHFCYKVGCRAIRSNASDLYCNDSNNNHSNECVLPGCTRPRSNRVNKVCELHASSIEVTKCPCGGVYIDGKCIACQLDELIGEDILSDDNSSRNIVCEHPDDKKVKGSDYIFVSEYYHGIKITCTQCGGWAMETIAHTDDNKNGICDVCLQNCHLLQDPTQVRKNNMTFFIKDSMTEGGHMFFGGNGEMNSQQDTLNTMGVAAEDVEGKVIMATTNATGESRNGNNWKAGTNVQVTVDQVKESGIDHLHGYSSGSQLAIATASALVKEGSDQIEEVVIYDGFFAADTVPGDFENVLQSGTQVTFYWVEATGKADYYQTAAERLREWQKLYPNLNIIPLPDATHGNVVKKAQEYQGKKFEKIEKCQRCGIESKTEIMNGYCGSCWEKIVNAKKETPTECKHSYDLTNKEYVWHSLDYHQVMTICTICKVPTSDYAPHKDQNRDGICDLCLNSCNVATAQKYGSDDKVCEHQYEDSGYKTKDKYYHFLVKTCAKCSEEKLTMGKHDYEAYSADRKCKLCGEVKCKKAQMSFDAGSDDATIMVFAGKDEMESFKATRARYERVIGDNEGEYVIVTTTEKSEGEGNSKNWIAGDNKDTTGDYIVNSGVKEIHTYSNSSHIAIEAVYNAKEKGAEVETLVMYDGFYGVTNDNAGHFEEIIANGTKVEFYYTIGILESYGKYSKRLKSVPEGYATWLQSQNGKGYQLPVKDGVFYKTNPEHYLEWLAEENPNFTFVKLGEDANHGNVVDKAQEYKEQQ